MAENRMTVKEAVELGEKHFDGACGCYLGYDSPICYEAKGFLKALDRMRPIIQKLQMQIGGHTPTNRNANFDNFKHLASGCNQCGIEEALSLWKEIEGK